MIQAIKNRLKNYRKQQIFGGHKHVYYNPLTDPVDIKIDPEKAKKWIANGAQPTETVRSLLKKAGITE